MKNLIFYYLISIIFSTTSNTLTENEVNDPILRIIVTDEQNEAIPAAIVDIQAPENALIGKKRTDRRGRTSKPIWNNRLSGNTNKSGFCEFIINTPGKYTVQIVDILYDTLIKEIIIKKSDFKQIPISRKFKLKKSETWLFSTASKQSAYYIIPNDIKRAAKDCGLSFAFELEDESKGSQDNLRRLVNNEVDIAIIQADVAADYILKNNKENIQVAFPMYAEQFHIVGLRDSINKYGITSTSNMDNKKNWTIGATKNSGSLFTLRRIKKLLGLNWKIVELERDIYVKPLLVFRTVDYIFFTESCPSKLFDDQENKRLGALKFVPINLPELEGKYEKSVIKATDYWWHDKYYHKDIETYQVQALIFVNTENSEHEEIVEEFTSPLLNDCVCDFLESNFFYYFYLWDKFYPIDVKQKFNPNNFTQRGLIPHPKLLESIENWDGDCRN